MEIPEVLLFWASGEHSAAAIDNVVKFKEVSFDQELVNPRVLRFDRGVVAM